MSPIDHKLQILLSYKNVSLETLMKLTALELRRICADAKLDCYRDGEKISRSRARKAEYAEAIFTNAQLLSNSEVEDEDSLPEIELQDEFKLSYESKYVSQFQEALVKLKMANRLNDVDGIVDASTDAQLLGVSAVNFLYESPNIGDTSVQSYSSSLLGRIKKEYRIKVSELNGDELRDEVKLYKYFKKGANGRVRKLGIKNKVDIQAQENQNVRQELGRDRVVEITPILKWAKDRVENLPILPLKNRDTSWREVALAVQLLTGRRIGEVQCTGKFQLVDSSTMLFSGQLKKREIDDHQFEIKILMEAGELINPALEWLEKTERRITPEKFNSDPLYERFRNKGMEAHRYVNGRYSKDLGTEVKRLIDRQVVLHSGQWVTPGVKGKGADVRVTHLLRQMYAKCYVLIWCSEYSASSLDVVSTMLGSVLGHEANTTSVRNYTKDIYLTTEDETNIINMNNQLVC